MDSIAFPIEETDTMMAHQCTLVGQSVEAVGYDLHCHRLHFHYRVVAVVVPVVATIIFLSLIIRII